MGTILCKGGRIWDGERFFSADILTEDNIIKQIAPNISAEADFAFDATGKTVSAGLVDAHVHMKGISIDEYGIHPALSTLPFGVTAAADASGEFGDKSMLGNIGIKNRVFVYAEIKNNHACFEKTKRKLSDFGEKAVGLKVVFDTEACDATDGTALGEAVEFAHRNGLIVMVHSSHSPISMSELLSILQPGDILTHAYHSGKNNAAEDGFKCIFDAKARGVVIDAGLAGNVHTDFTVMEKAIQSGAAPDVISTDITRLSAYKRGGRYGLPLCMSIAHSFGMDEASIFKAVTSAPADALNCPEWGRLSVGGTADIAVLEFSDEGFDLTDEAGRRIQSGIGYRNILTISDGEVVYRR